MCNPPPPLSRDPRVVLPGVLGASSSPPASSTTPTPSDVARAGEFIILLDGPLSSAFTSPPSAAAIALASIASKSIAGGAGHGCPLPDRVLDSRTAAAAASSSRTRQPGSSCGSSRGRGGLLRGLTAVVGRRSVAGVGGASWSDHGARVHRLGRDNWGGGGNTAEESSPPRRRRRLRRHARRVCIPSADGAQYRALLGRPIADGRSLELVVHRRCGAGSGAGGGRSLRATIRREAREHADWRRVNRLLATRPSSTRPCRLPGP